MERSVLALFRDGVVWLLAFGVAVGCAAAVTRLATRTRYFSIPAWEPDTWHGRPRGGSERADRDGLNPFVLAFVTFWIAFTGAVIALDGPLPG
ncbi:hypothetical protein I7X12_18425 [Halosimplex litoreum]|uniref:Uncharacterized protein n=1 Tax=Halosimplex litoreum TaxID=1198301 RepID=A0A7T3FYM7_9EURY|nr:hypothetical protein [Halosimplex litoreum]QPV62678.1 hypothetical protein I7X12_18425 [Halosimplex litoreum]